MKLSNPRLRGRKVSDQCKKAVVKNYVGTCRWHVLFGHQAIIGELYMPQLPAGRFGMSIHNYICLFNISTGFYC